MTGKAVSDKKLNIDDLKKCREKLSESINISSSQALDAHNHNKISSSDFQEAQKKWEKLEIQESELSGKIMALQLDYLLETNVNSPMSRIVGATDKLNAAATDIRNFQHFLDSIADVINIFDSLIKAIPNGLIANI
ncbi:MAG: hypothetical protein V7L00_05390 [Nostoc sp.]|uniref:hypothetical protein n=1 Tax=unclassified Nostoc TaxID=2593658 RepID=UPI0025D0B026|nr:hypothetical protein [Nostoc sp. JL33]MBN3869043.1 hypothetical protein [Nostoc sp. JL33]